MKEWAIFKHFEEHLIMQSKARFHILCMLPRIMPSRQVSNISKPDSTPSCTKHNSTTYLTFSRPTWCGPAHMMCEYSSLWCVSVFRADEPSTLSLCTVPSLCPVRVSAESGTRGRGRDGRGSRWRANGCIPLRPCSAFWASPSTPWASPSLLSLPGLLQWGQWGLVGTVGQSYLVTDLNTFCRLSAILPPHDDGSNPYEVDLNNKSQLKVGK